MEGEAELPEDGATLGAGLVTVGPALGKAEAADGVSLAADGLNEGDEVMPSVG